MFFLLEAEGYCQELCSMVKCRCLRQREQIQVLSFSRMKDFLNRHCLCRLESGKFEREICWRNTKPGQNCHHHIHWPVTDREKAEWTLLLNTQSYEIVSQKKGIEKLDLKEVIKAMKKKDGEIEVQEMVKISVVP